MFGSHWAQEGSLPLLGEDVICLQLPGQQLEEGLPVGLAPLDLSFAFKVCGIKRNKEGVCNL